MTVDELAARRAAMDGLGELMAAAMTADDGVVDARIWIDAPGVYPDVPDRDYHLDPVLGGSLSSHGARLLLPPSCPALFQWRKTHPRPDKDEFDFGHAAHQMVLGVGPEIVECKFDDWRTKAAKQARDEARKAGKVPLLTEALRRVRAMAEAIQAHPLASRLFAPGAGQPEVTLVWRDPETGVWCRARVDWLPEVNPMGRPILVDLKTADSADKGKFARSAANFGYAQQDAWYLDGAAALGMTDPAFVFVVIERDPPHLINVIELDQPSIDAGRARNRAALSIYAACVAADEWPSYSTEVELVTLPAWYLMQDPNPSIGET